MVISGGVNVYPVEVENVLIDHPAVLDCAVFGVPHGDLGEELVAVVQPLGAPDPDLVTTLVKHCRDRLAGVKVPRRIEIVGTLSRLPTGKVRKRELREKFAAEPAR